MLTKRQQSALREARPLRAAGRRGQHRGRAESDRLARPRGQATAQGSRGGHSPIRWLGSRREGGVATGVRSRGRRGLRHSQRREAREVAEGSHGSRRGALGRGSSRRVSAAFGSRWHTSRSASARRWSAASGRVGGLADVTFSRSVQRAVQDKERSHLRTSGDGAFRIDFPRELLPRRSVGLRPTGTAVTSRYRGGASITRCDAPEPARRGPR